MRDFKLSVNAGLVLSFRDKSVNEKPLSKWLWISSWAYLEPPHVENEAQKAKERNEDLFMCIDLSVTTEALKLQPQDTRQSDGVHSYGRHLMRM